MVGESSDDNEETDDYFFARGEATRNIAGLSWTAGVLVDCFFLLIFSSGFFELIARTISSSLKMIGRVVSIIWCYLKEILVVNDKIMEVPTLSGCTLTSRFVTHVNPL